MDRYTEKQLADNRVRLAFETKRKDQIQVHLPVLSEEMKKKVEVIALGRGLLSGVMSMQEAEPSLFEDERMDDYIRTLNEELTR